MGEGEAVGVAQSVGGVEESGQEIFLAVGEWQTRRPFSVRPRGHFFARWWGRGQSFGIVYTRWRFFRTLICGIMLSLIGLRFLMARAWRFSLDVYWARMLLWTGTVCSACGQFIEKGGGMDVEVIGRTIRDLRRQRDIGLRELVAAGGDLAGVFDGDREGQSSPTLATLHKVLRAFGDGLCGFFWRV